MEARTTSAPVAGARQTGIRRLVTETKQAFKTTEFWVYVAILIGLFIAGAVADADATAAAESDPEGTFGPEKVWLYAVILTVGYMISRGLAKAGSRDPYWDRSSEGGDGAPLTERVKSAAQVLKDGEEPHAGSASTPR